MSHSKNDLYRWERVSKPRVYSRSQRVTSEDDIQDWIKKVEDASNKAACATFGTKYSPVSYPPAAAKATVAARVADVHLHDAAYAEAQELLQQWVNDKINIDGEMEYSEEAWTRKTESEIRKEWDHLLDHEEEASDIDFTGRTGNSSRSPRKPSKDPYSILNADDGYLVDEVLQNLMDKEVVADDFIQDLGLEQRTKTRDPRTKMTLRHQQVKENRMKRETERERKLREQQAKKDAQFQARKIIQKEEQAKVQKQKHEEDAIQREMARIRKEMEEERQRKQEHLLREHKDKDEFESKVHKEMDRQKEEEIRKQIRAESVAENKKQEIMSRLEELQTWEITQNMKLKQRCFSAWYNIMIKRHLAMGKAKAMCDWKLLRKTFNAWKSFVRSQGLQREAYRHEQQIKLLQRKETVASNHYIQTLLRKCFVAWQLYMTQEQNSRLLNTEHHKTKSKMAAFLEAAASGKLWSARSDEGESSRSQAENGSTTDRQVDDIFADKGRKVVPPGSSRSDTSSMNSSRIDRSSGGKTRNHAPKQAWQIGRKDVEVTKEELASVAKGQGQGDSSKGNPSHGDSPPKIDSTPGSNQKLKKAPFVANNFEHRHNAQQKILDTQQKQIKEQQRLIEEMQYLQKQQLLNQQLVQQQLLQKQLSAQKPDSVDVKNINHKGAKKIQAESTGKNIQALVIEDLESVKEEANTVVSNADSGGNTNRTDASAASGAISAASGATSAASGATSAAGTKSVVPSTSTTASKHSKFLKSMDERAAERARIKREREEKRQKEEQEKLAVLAAQEEELRKAEEQEKMKRVEAYREKKRLEKQREQERIQQQEIFRQQMAVAEEHSRLRHMKYRGWLPWCYLMAMARHRRLEAEKHYRTSLVRKVFCSWHSSVSEELAEKRDLADKMHQYILVRRCLANWKKLGHHMGILEEKAQRHYETRLKVKVTRAWSDYATEEKIASWKRERNAKEHNTRRIMLTALRAWRRFPRVQEEEEIKQKRLGEMRRKVASMLPDFEGVSSSQTRTSTDLL